MASDDTTRPHAATWRPDAPAPEVDFTGPLWRREEEIKRQHARRRKTGRLAAVGALFLALAGTLVWVSFWLTPPRPATFVLIGAGYEDNLAVPINVYGRAGMNALKELAKSDAASPIRQAGLLRLKRNPVELRRDSAWDADLDTFAEKTIVVYFAVHGGRDRDGPYLLPQDADLSDQNREQNRLRLEAVIDRLGQLPAEKNKLLILDATQVAADWSLGMLHNDFARGLKGLEQKVRDIPRLVVVSASAEDQRSHASDEWRRSVFTHYLTEGLRGAADVEGVSRIDAWTLFSYVQENVERWARINREARQTPMLLPEGEEGEQRARAMDLTMVQEEYAAPDASQLPAFAPPPEVQRAWDEYRQLATDAPSPAVYSPHLWRLYQALLLRYEQLLLADDPDSAATVAAQLGAVGRQVQKLRRLELSPALYNALPMPAAAGLLTEPRQFASTFNDLWASDRAGFAKKWAEVQAKASTDPSNRLLAWRVADEAIEQAAANPRANLDKAYHLLQAVTPPDNRSIEAHYLAMLRRDLPASAPPPELVQQALRVRRLAERAALAVTDQKARPEEPPPLFAKQRHLVPNDGFILPYSEQVILWTRMRVLEADGQRRQGEDLLFATDDKSWARAADHLQNAARMYLEITGDPKFVGADPKQVRPLGTAEVLRNCLATRDQLLAALPFYAQWLGQTQAVLGGPRAPADDALMQRAEALCADTHRLAALLEPHAEEPGKPVTVDVKALGVLADGLEQRFGDLHGEWVESWREADVINTPAALRAAAAALAVPVPNTAQRLRLIANQRRISRDLLMRADQLDAKAGTVSEEVNRDQAKAQARRQGRMALAALGNRWFDEIKQPVTFVETRHHLDVFAAESQWWHSSITAMGEAIGSRYRQLPREIDARLTAARSLSTKAASARAAILAQLRGADRLARLVPGAAAPLVQAGNPGDQYRRWLAQDLLLVQAQRTFEDHWFAEADGVVPYFRAAGLRYLADAETLAPGQAIVKDLQDRFKLPGELEFRGPAALVGTSEQRLDAEYRLVPAGSALVPDGQPVLWIETDKALAALAPEPNQRLVWSLDRKQEAAPVRVQLASSLLIEAEANPPTVPQVEHARLKVRGLFRGQRIVADTPVQLHPLPEIALVLPGTPNLGGIAVRAPKDMQVRFGAANAALTVVLDCSGSMAEPGGRPFTPKTKYNEVTRALRDVLARLPRGTMVSIWVCGQAVGGARTVEQAEDTVRRIQEPIAWQPERLNQVMAKVEYPNLQPWNESPIVHAMLRAKEDLKGGTGLKTMLVLTDGIDNRFLTDKVLNEKGRSVEATLREEFASAGIVVNIVGFKVVPMEAAAAAEQFKVVEQLALPGKYYTVDDVVDLTVAVGKTTRQKLRYWVDREDNAPAPGSRPDGLDVSSVGANDQWLPGGLPPGGYKVRLLTDRRLQKSAVIERGDLLLVQLANLGGELTRGIWSRDDFPGRPAARQADWRLGVLQNQRVGDTGLAMLATLEKEPVADEAVLQLVKPRECWFELTPRLGEGEKTQPYAVRFTHLSGYPAPAWGLDSAAWPLRSETQLPAAPILRTWWSPDVEPLGAPLIPGQAPRVDGDTLDLHGIVVEKHLVEVRPGVREVRDCLVVRLGHAPDRPVRVRLGEMRVEGQEHRWYTAASKYTALFWPVPEAALKQASKGLTVWSVNAFKRDARERGYYLEMDKLGPPIAGDRRPQPVRHEEPARKRADPDKPLPGR